MSTLRSDALYHALQELQAGAREIGGNNRGPAIRKYLSGAGLGEGYAWCASYCSWCYQQAATNLGVPLPFGYQAVALDIFRTCRAKGWVVDEPEPGDLVFWRRGPVETNQGHVGFVLLAHDGRFQTVEGNHTPEVAKFSYDVSEELLKPYNRRLVGFVRVGGT